MSILPLTGMAATVIGMFSISLPVVDTGYTNVRGEDKQTVLGARSINAAVDASSRKQLEQIFGQGAVSDGDIGIYTMGILYMIDKGDTRQSFVDYNGMQYRICADNDWRTQAGCKVYLGRRHVKQDLV